MKLQQHLLFSAIAIVLSFCQYESSFATSQASHSTKLSPAQRQEVEQLIRSTLINKPEILIEASRALQQKQQQHMLTKAQKAIQSNAQALFHNDSPTAGNPKGDIVIVEFYDYQCIHCKEMDPVIANLLASDKNIKIIYKEFPIFGGSSQFAARAALAANEQGKFLQLHKALMKHRQALTDKVILSIAKKQGLDITKLEADMKSPNIKKQLEKNVKLSEALGLGGTPAFVIAKDTNGNEPKAFFVPGAANKSMLQNFIKQVRAM